MVRIRLKACSKLENNALKIVPDIGFKKELIRISGSPLNQCMQCGSCSAVCSLAPEERPFPRKEMIWAGWGMKEQLMGNVDIWLCHQCGDCSVTCPRDVKPADVLAAVRQKSYEHYARPRFMGKLLSGPAMLPVAVLLPVSVVVLILSMAGTFTIPAGEIDYSAFFPHVWLNSTFTGMTIFSYTLAFFGWRAFLKDMRKLYPSGSQNGGGKSGFFSVMTEILLHRNFSGCQTGRARKVAHILLFSGFALLILVTLYAIWASFHERYPLALTHPFKIAGNIASVLIYIGLGMMIFHRLKRKEIFGRSNYADWLLLVSIGLLTLSGTLVEWARFGNWQVAYHLYFFHLVAVWFVIIYLPWTKMGHMVFRSLALIHARSIGRR